MKERTTFERVRSDPRTCVHCGKADRRHTWECSTCGATLEMDIDGLPAKLCHGSATLYCGWVS